MFPLTVFFLYLIALCDLTVASPEVTAENTVTVDLWLPAVQSLPVGAYAATELGVNKGVSTYNLCFNGALKEFCDKYGYFVTQGPKTYEFSNKEPILPTKTIVKCSLDGTTSAVCTRTASHLDQASRVDESIATITESSELERTPVPLVYKAGSAPRTRGTVSWAVGSLVVVMGIFASL